MPPIGTVRVTCLIRLRTFSDYLPRFKRGTWGLLLPEFLRTGVDHTYIPGLVSLEKATRPSSFAIL